MKYLCFSIVLLLGFFLTACNEGEQQNITENDDVSEGTSESEIGSDDQENGSDDGTTGETKNGEEGISAEDQLGLKIGDTAKVENNFTEFEVTLDAVEVTEKAGETPSEQGNYVILDLTVKNLSNEPLTGVDAFSSTSLETKENSSGFTWFYIDGVVEAWNSEIAPGEAQSGSLLFDVAKSEEYIMTMAKHLEGLSNYVTFTFSPEESK
ncbi:telomeric repeat-binding factor 2 [Oceanobacillus picturae]|jgi:Domain of unknown function (DUF4352)|uniref:Telomeric repeat-binding factor 2 n=1 Tax=Oceanobacillus picturae TaxID=171693 RepID=A0A0U9HB84_9BACI|nr:DUF4352 domain-containing protein [Oceanobacillus picturae]GAQ19907.1 telomeric repeat-binding factor 2 [Oceanobacillus picturae]